MLASRASGGSFTCELCANAAGRPIELRWPPERADIEEALLRRPVEARNWEPSESVALLQAENAEHRMEMV